MARPSLTSAEELAMRKSILLQAARIIATRGYEALSMRALADAVGLSPGALYRYFPSKHDVLVAHSADAVTQMTERLKNIAAAALPPMDAIKAMMLDYCKFCAEDRDRFLVLTRYDGEASAEGRLPHKDVHEAFGVAQGQVARAIAAGEIETQSDQSAALILWACAHGLVSLWTSVKDIEIGDAKSFFELGISTVLRGLRPESKVQ